MLNKLKSDLNKLKNSDKIEVYQWFFKTGPGEYGEGDIFLGLQMAQNRQIAKKYVDLKLPDVQKLLNSKIHEHRMVAVLILVAKYKKSRDPSLPPVAQDDIRKKIYNFYIKNAKKINNWDLVDLSAPHIIGDYLLHTPFRGDRDKKLKTLPKGSMKNREILYKLAQSKNLWERRISIISTGTFIYHNQFKDTIKICEILLKDENDLIHKACGWMLREMGKRDEKVLTKFLDKHATSMPRTMLRYSIEKFQEKKRKFYLNK